MNYRDYLRLAEDAAHAAHISACVAAIVAEYGRTLYDAQRGAFSSTDAGVYLAWKLADGSFVHSGDPRELDPALVAHIIDVGVGSSVEGSEAYVPVRWLNLPGRCHPDGEPGVETPEDAARLFREVVGLVDNEASVLWREEHGEGPAGGAP